ncbi:MoxR family ATPase [Idiomarina seosinensis]|uniref:AAA family ATPase n=1 Tax=Idiomarina seosinensis TaxID=281739 RepID=UPI00384F1C6C
MAASQFKTLHEFLNRQVLGQPQFTRNLLLAVLADGHLLVESPPGLAKTRAVQALAKGIEGDFHRVQFTPDLLPADLTGTDIYRPENATFEFQQGPLFHNLILADEINRAPAKVQSALLEAMAERQITVGQRSYPLPQLFMVLATQNPLEQEGTYPLPEAQLDRFLMHLNLDYPDAATEQQILRLNRGEVIEGEEAMPTPLTQQQLFEARQQVMQVYLDEAVEHYLVQLIIATRAPDNYDTELAGWLEYGASPRATIALERCARASAWLDGRDFVTPDDVRGILHNCLRHRIIISYQAEADGITPNQVIDRILQLVPAP